MHEQGINNIAVVVGMLKEQVSNRPSIQLSYQRGVVVAAYKHGIIPRTVYRMLMGSLTYDNSIFQIETQDCLKF